MKKINSLVTAVLSCSLASLPFLPLFLPLASVAADDYVAPRTEWGQPDLQGVWNFSSNTPMQRPEHYNERQFLTSDEVAEMRQQRAEADAASDAAIPNAGVDTSYNDFWIESAGIGGDARTSHIVYPANGRIPERAQDAITQFTTLDEGSGPRPVRFAAGGIGANGPEDRGLSERCLVGFNAGPPFVPSLYNNNVQIFQSRDTAVIMTEMIHDARIVALDDRPLLAEEIRLWSGDSRGHWDGDTLVVATRNFNDLTQSFSAYGTSKDKLLIERFTRVDDFTVNYEFTIEDPATFTDKISAIVAMTKVGGLLYEYACHEGNYGMENILRGARVQERLAASEEQ